MNRRTLTRFAAVAALAGLLSPARADEAATNQTALAFPEVAESIVIVEFYRGGIDHQASGVVAKMGDQAYILVNQHVLLGAERPSFTTGAGVKLAPRGVELSTNRDLARLLITDAVPALEIVAERAKMNTPVTLIKVNAEAGERTDEGSIIGIGGLKFEVSTAFKKQDNGAPVLDAEKRVVGIASHTQESRKNAMKKGTRFEEDRYFCYRVDEKGWQRVNWRTYSRLYASAYREQKELGDEIITIFENSKGKVNQRKAGELATACRTQSRKIEMLTEKHGMTDYLRNELEEHAELFEFAEEFFGQQAKH